MRAAAATLMAMSATLALGGCETLRRERPPKLALPPPVTAPAPAPVLALPKPPPPQQPAPPKSCVPKTLSPPPRYPDTDGALRASPGAADRYQLMAAGRILRKQRLDELERVVAGCR